MSVPRQTYLHYSTIKLVISTEGQSPKTSCIDNSYRVYPTLQRDHNNMLTLCHLKFSMQSYLTQQQIIIHWCSLNSINNLSQVPVDCNDCSFLTNVLISDVERDHLGMLLFYYSWECRSFIIG